MDKKDDLLKNKIWKLFLLLLFICNVVIRFYKLGTNIPNAYVDEAAIGYSSWCLANYGIDRYLNSFPIYIKNFYGGSSAAYSYLLIPIIKIFGLNLFSERFLNAFAFAVVFPVIYLILKRVLKSRLSIALTLLVYTFSPFVIILSRTGLDCNLLFPTIVIAFYFTLKAMETEQTKWYAAAAAVYGFSLYTYALAYIIVPVFLILIFIYMELSRKITLKQVFVVIGILVCMGIPILVQLITLLLNKETWSFGPFTFISMTVKRTKEFSLSYIWDNLKKLLIIMPIHEDSMFCSISFCNFYALSIPFMIYGIIRSIKAALKEKSEGMILALGLFVISFGTFLITKRVFLYKTNVLILPIILFIGYGIDEFLMNMKIEKCIIMTGIYLMSSLLFINSYFISGEFQDWFKDNYSITEDDFHEVLDYADQFQINSNTNNTELTASASSSVPDIYIIGGDNNWIYIPFYLGGIDPHEISNLDDTKDVWDYSYKNIHVEEPKEYDKTAIYAVSKNFLSKEYDKKHIKNIIKQCPNQINLTYYTVYTSNVNESAIK